MKAKKIPRGAQKLLAGFFSPFRHSVYIDEHGRPEGDLNTPASPEKWGIKKRKPLIYKDFRAMVVATGLEPVTPSM